MTKYGITMVTERKFTDSQHTEKHFIVMKKGLTSEQANAAFNRAVEDLSTLMGRNATCRHTRGVRNVSAEWLVQEGQPGQDMAIFIDEYEDEQ